MLNLDLLRTVETQLVISVRCGLLQLFLLPLLEPAFCWSRRRVAKSSRIGSALTDIRPFFGPPFAGHPVQAALARHHNCRRRTTRDSWLGRPIVEQHLAAHPRCLVNRFAHCALSTLKLTSVLLSSSLMQICCLILGPALFMAAMYLVRGLG